MEYHYTQATLDSELEEILALQRRNTKRSPESSEIMQDGFVTVEQSLDLLKKMNAIAPHVIAKQNNVVVGYALCMRPSFGNDIPILESRFRELERLGVADYMIMGQICVVKAHRKQGFFRSLYATMKSQLTENYKQLITEVDATNTRSLHAHLAIGFKTLSTYTANDRDWVVLLLSVYDNDSINTIR